jgi:hypothetical protein
MKALALALLLAAPSQAAFLFRAQPVTLNIPSAAASAAAPQAVQSLSMMGGAYSVNGLKATELGFGSFKTVVLHPQAPEAVVKIFSDKYGSGVTEKRNELAQLALLPPSAVPAVLAHGETKVDGKATAYLVQERVNGLTLERPTRTKLEEVKKLFERLAKARVEIADNASAIKLRQNIMVGETKSGGFGAYLVDPDVTKSDKSDRELRAFYDGLLTKIADGR